jgi:hypothetical protein
MATRVLKSPQLPTYRFIYYIFFSTFFFMSHFLSIIG